MPIARTNPMRRQTVKMQGRPQQKKQPRRGVILLSAVFAPLLGSLALSLTLSAATLCSAQTNPAPTMLEEVVLRNGFSIVCNHEQTVGQKVRLYLDATDQNFLTVAANQIASRTPVPASEVEPALTPRQAVQATPQKPESLHEMLAAAGHKHDIDTLLLESIVAQESGGHPRAVSRAGARGLMQLMPDTATQMGVTNSFAPAQNIAGGTTYLDELLDRYHNNLALALAAYNAGPAAVARWHGIPPYTETRRYVARVIHNYNLRYEAMLRARKHAQKRQPIRTAVVTLASISTGAKIE